MRCGWGWPAGLAPASVPACSAWTSWKQARAWPGWSASSRQARPSGTRWPDAAGNTGHVPDDGLTTRQRRNRPLLIVHTGAGKGKSTAAFGLALRAWNQGWPVGVFQFVKSAKWRVGEERALRVLGGDRRGRRGDLAQDGRGLVLDPARPRQTRPTEAAEGWAQIKRDLAAQTYGLYVLDEFTYPMKWGWVDVDEVVACWPAGPASSTW